MATVEQLNKQIAEFLPEADAEAYQKSDDISISLTGDGEIWRAWPELSPDRIPQAINFLNTYTSVKNFEKDTPLRYVDDPKVGSEPWAGRWRQAYVRRVKQGQVTQLVQVLRKGYARELKDDEARMSGGSYRSIEPKKVMERQYVAIDPEYFNDILEKIYESDFVENPVIENESYEGDYRIINNEPSVANDGSGILTQTLVLGWITTDDALPTPVLISDEKVLLSPFIHDTTSEANLYMWEYRGIDPSYAQTLRDTISLTFGVKSAVVVKVEDGSCSIRATTESRTWTGTLSHKWRYNVVHPGFNAQQIVTKFSHIPEASLATFRTTLSTADTNHKIVSLDDVSSGEGFVDITQLQERVFIGTASAGNGVDTNYNLATGLLALLTDGSVVTTMWLKVPNGDITTAMTTLKTAPSGYTVIGLSNTYNGTGSANITRVMVTKDDSTSIEIASYWPEFDSERKTYAYLGLDKTAAESLRTSLKTDVDSGYKVDSVTIQDGYSGSLTVIQNISKLISAVSEATGITTRYEYEYWGDSESITTTWLHVADDDHEAALTTLATAPDGYTTVMIGDNFNGTGACDITRVIVKENTDGMETAIMFPNFAGERMTFVYLGLDKTDAEAKYTDLQTTLSGSLDSTKYKIDTVDIARGVRGTLTVIQRVSKTNVAGSETERIQAVRHTDAFGLVDRTTTVLLNVQYAQLAAAKVTIEADATKNILDIFDNDNGQGSANIVYTWRTKPESITSMGALSAVKQGQFHKVTEDRVWIDVDIDDADSLKTAVAAALAGTGDYSVEASEAILASSVNDNGDKTGTITQRVIKEGTDDYADYSQQVSINPHGLQEAVIVTSVREYPEVAYTNGGAVFALLQTFLGDPTKGRIQASINANDTLAMRGLKEGTPGWNNTTPEYVKVGVRNEGLIGESKTELATGVPVANAAAIVNNATADADHVLEDVRMTERGQGEAIIEKRQTQKSETAVEIEELPVLGLRRAMKNYTWPLVLSDNIGTVWAAAATEGVSGDYVLHFRQKNILSNGMFSVTSRIVDCPEVTQDSRVISYTDSATITEEKHQDALLIPDTEDNEGTEETVRGGLNLYNKYDYVKIITTTRTPKSAAGSTSWHIFGNPKWVAVASYFPNDVAEKSFTSALIYRYRDFTHTITFHATAALAATAITEGRTGSSISQVAGNLWMAKKVTWEWVVTDTIILAQPKFTDNLDGRSVPIKN